jgi:hypothetical protein
MYLCHSSSWQREFQNALETAGFVKGGVIIDHRGGGTVDHFLGS